MNCLLVFDHLNDIVFTKYNNKFEQHINNFSKAQGLFESNNLVQNDIIVQMFAPIIASHRIMSCQFGNSYTSIQCEDNLSILFEEYMGYLFVAISNDKLPSIKKYLAVSVTISRYLCGPDIYQLKSSHKKGKLLSEMLDSWRELYFTDQSIFVEAIEQLIVNSDLSSSTIQTLKESVDKLTSIELSKTHALCLVQNKFLSLYSTQNAKELSPSDILFVTIFCHTVLKHSKGIQSQQCLLNGPEPNPKCLPHIIHVIPITDSVNLIYLIEIGNSAVASSLYETFCHLHVIQIVQIQRDKAILQPAFDNLDLAVKRLNDSLKKNKDTMIDNSHKQLVKKWDIIKKKYQEYLKSNSDGALLRAETLALGFLENLKELFSLTSIDDSIVEGSLKQIEASANFVKEKMSSFKDFLEVKTLNNFSLGSTSLTINKYMEEFPGLVHFLYIDRTTHRITTPTLDLNSPEVQFTKNKIWFMIEFAQQHLQEGTLSLIWKDTTFNYSYFLWFEDAAGSPLKPTLLPGQSFGTPGIFCSDFYTKLKEVCFPKMSNDKIRCYELFCMHLGLVTASCVLEQTRRLSATIWELKGHPSHPIDLL